MKICNLDQKQAGLSVGCKWELVGEFTEIETGKRADRPQWEKAIAACKKTAARGIIAKPDRLSHKVAFIATLMERKLDFLAVDSPTATKFTIHVPAAVAEFERDAISKPTTEALAVAKARGVIQHGPREGQPLVRGNYARIPKAKQEATKARAEAVRPRRDITTVSGKRWQATQVICARRRLGLIAALPSDRPRPRGSFLGRDRGAGPQASANRFRFLGLCFRRRERTRSACSRVPWPPARIRS
jgi:DNA invertase Pin-like site-specific DNA recombinase